MALNTWPVVDSHCHLEEITPLPQALKEAAGQGVVGIVAVGSDQESNRKVLEIARRFPSLVFHALGLHPWSLSRGGVEAGIAFIAQNLDRAVAIGEVGLDYDKRVLKGAGKDLQQGVLRELLSLAVKHHKPALLHSRYAWRDALEIALGMGVEGAVFHWFTGPSGVLREVLGAGYYISATPALAYHPEHRRAVREAPLERLLLETDSPVEYRQGLGRPSRPADVAYVLAQVSALKGVEPERVARATTESAIRLLGLQNRKLVLSRNETSKI